MPTRARRFANCYTPAERADLVAVYKNLKRDPPTYRVYSELVELEQERTEAGAADYLPLFTDPPGLLVSTSLDPSTSCSSFVDRAPKKFASLLQASEDMGLGYKCRAKRGAHQRRNNEHKDIASTAHPSPAVADEHALQLATRASSTSFVPSTSTRAARRRARAQPARQEGMASIVGMVEVKPAKRLPKAKPLPSSTRRDRPHSFRETELRYNRIAGRISEYAQKFKGWSGRKKHRKLERLMWNRDSLSEESKVSSNNSAHSRRRRLRNPYSALAMLIIVAILVFLIPALAISRRD
ncbi:hypothetical protein NM688_g8132 [Phlebia brevispora]|uniref:Uncharacterized protein n=1 Tax=Phlebia brevispora TaxID=194682 RepID=A0ACC1RWU9_9APHY|nr:hypothetical protein NM688_g8132 [Phlebia brevispora]